MFIEFQKVRWKNFLSTGNSFNEIELNKNHTTFLSGESGQGKSTYVDAICFALFNKPFRNVNKPDLVNSINRKDCVAEIEFVIGTTHYLIRRGIAPSVFEIIINGKLLDQSSDNRDYQEYLEKHVLKFNYKLFCQKVVLGASNFTPFMSLKASERRTITENILDIQIFSQMNILLKSNISDNENLIEDNIQNIARYDQQLKFCEATLKNANKDKDNQISDKLVKLETNNKLILDHTEQLTQLSRKEINLLNLLEKENSVDDKVLKILQTKSKLENKISIISKEISFFEAHQECPTCKQNIELDFKNSKIDKEKKNVDNYNNQLIKLNDILISAQEEKTNIKETKKEYNKIRISIEKINNTIKHLNDVKITLEQDIQKAKEKHSTIDIEDKIKELSVEKQKSEESLKTCIQQKKIYELGSHLLKDDGIKSKIIKQYIPIINKAVNQYLHEMNFFIKFEIDENFEDRILSRGTDEMSYNNLSDGEKQRANLAILFAWRYIAQLKNSINTNLLILDEVLDSFLDDTATDNVIKLLDSNFLKGMNIFIISHKNIGEKFERVIKFTKQQNFSIIS